MFFIVGFLFLRWQSLFGATFVRIAQSTLYGPLLIPPGYRPTFVAAVLVAFRRKKLVL